MILGAGASFDCASSECVTPGELDRRPPLVTDLFAPRFADILNNYPMAQMAASVIRSHLGNSMALEQFLRDHLRDSDHPADRSKFHAIHYYLQELLFRCGSEFTRHPDNYDRLIDLTERLDRVVYISLNYDTILDDRLAHYSDDRLGWLGDYCVPRRRWSLVKPHGSVNWGLPVLDVRPNDAAGFAGNPPPEIKLKEGDYRLLPRNLGKMRELYSQHEHSLVYPAISAPVGAPDAFTCPSDHIDFLRREIERQEVLNVLMVGYSGLDNEVMRLFAGKRLGAVQAVAGNLNQARSAMGKLVEAVTGTTAGGVPKPFAGSFSEFVGGSGLSDFINRFKDESRHAPR